MTVTIVLGKATDGYAYSYDANYTNSRNGPADGVTGGAVGYIGQNHNSGYQQFQTFIGFDYSAVPATEQVVAAEVHLSVASVLSPATSRTLEVRGLAWSSGGLTTGDWRNISNLAATPVDGQAWNLHQANGKRMVASSDGLAFKVQGVTTFDFVVVTDKQRAGITPSEDQGASVYTADADGTSSDPALVFTTLTRNKLVPALGAGVELSDGSWVHIITSGTHPATASLVHVTTAGVQTTVGSIPVGSSSSTFSSPLGAQGWALCRDSTDSLFVLGRLGNSQNSIAARAYVKAAGYNWTPGVLRSTGIAAYDGSINNVAAAWHSTAGGRIFTLVSHNPGTGANSSHSYATGDMSWVVLDSVYLKTGGGSYLKGAGTAVGTVVGSGVKAGFHGLPTNETGTLLDVTAAGGSNPSWGFTASVSKNAALGDNQPVSLGRYILNSAGDGLAGYSTWSLTNYAVKDANAKLRVLRVSDSIAAVVSADSDSGWGLGVSLMQYNGASEPYPNQLGFQNLGGEAITNLPNEATTAKAPWWDAVYNESSNQVWLYYQDSTAPNAIRRTAIDLTTMQPVRNSVMVWAGAVGSVIQAIRVPRNSAVTERVLVEVASVLSGVLSSTTVIDTFNLPPTAPILTPPTNYDATVAKAFTWTPTDPNPGDTQSAYQLQILDADLGTTALDTGKVTSTVSSHNVAGGTLTNVKSYQWRVKTWDALDAEGDWSEYSTFQTSAGGQVTITDPAVDNPVGLDTDDTYVTWTVTGATVQASYRIILRRMSTLAVVSDTGWVTSTATTALVSGMATDVQYRVEIQVRNAALVLSGIGQRLLTPSYATPEAPVVTLSDMSDQGYMLVSVTNPLPGQPEVPGSPEYGFETGTGSWAGIGCTLAAEATVVHSGTGSLKLTAVASPVQMYARDYTNKIPVVVGTRYTARQWVNRPVAGPVTLAIDWLDGSNVTLSSTEATIGAVPANTWTLMQVTGLCPAGTVNAVFGPTVKGSPATGTILYVDDAALTGASDRPDVVTNQVMRRRQGTEPWELVGNIGVDSTIRDYGSTSGRLYEYKARGITA
jgi:hypothetical protein